jgi:hypothetical protein
MIRLYLIAEGKTEQVFCNQLLVPHLADHSVMLQGTRLIRTGKKCTEEYRGGFISYHHLEREITNLLKQDKASDARFSTMLDLYHLPSNFPGYVDRKKESDPYRRVALLEKKLAEAVQDPRFVPYLQLYEFEALLLANPQAFDIYYDKYPREIEKLVDLVTDFNSPEQINDGENTAPSKRIASLIPDYSRAKPTAGPIIAAKIGLPAIREKCPHFDAWLRRLESLGQNPQ